MNSFPAIETIGVVILLGWSVLAATDQAHASTYRTSGGSTVVVLTEPARAAGSPGGFYFTQSAHRPWKGAITISQTTAGAGHTFYTGTFQDQAIGPGPTLICTGTIAIRRRNPGISDTITADTTWRITGGKGCPSVGQTVMLSLVEPLPRPNRLGDFNAANANTFRSETNGDGTWPAWRVVAADGALNCRVAPNGPIKRVYSANERIVPELRGINAFVMSNGSAWLQTRHGCYVRANSRYLQPITIPI